MKVTLFVLKRRGEEFRLPGWLNYGLAAGPLAAKAWRRYDGIDCERHGFRPPRSCKTSCCLQV